jgi:hypothetical protein
MSFISSLKTAAACSGRTDTAPIIYRSLELNNFSQRTRARGRSSRKIVGISLVVVVALVAAAALVQNRGLQIDAKHNGVGVKLDPAEQPAPSIATHNDGSPIVTAPDAKVNVHVTGPTKSAPAQTPVKDGMSTHGAASPIVTGQGAVVKSTVDTRP